MPAPAESALIALLPNARDLGGLEHDAGTTAHGVVVRSAAPLLPEHADAIDALGFVAVLDLRGAEEVVKQPNAARTDLVQHLDVLADAPQDAAAALAPLVASLMGTGPAPDLSQLIPDLRGLMIESYRDFVRLPSAQTASAQVLRAVLEAEGPVLLHCTAGKDRTGWLSAVLLELAGVPWETITEDYLRSGLQMEELFMPFRELMVRRGIDPTIFDPLLGVDAAWLAEARATAQAMHGSVAEYVLRGLGLSERELQALRAKLRGDLAARG